MSRGGEAVGPKGAGLKENPIIWHETFTGPMTSCGKLGPEMEFANRREAGQRLAEQIKTLGLKEAVVYAIPRGGVPVARPVAESLHAEIDVVLAHKFTSPWRSELALGSVTDAGDIWFAPHAAKFLNEEELQEAAASEVERLKRKRSQFSPLREPVSPDGRDVVIVDDGIATGATAVAAVRSMKGRGAGRIVVAVPVASQRALERLREEGAELCLLLVSESFQSVSEFYDDFSPVSDEEVMKDLKAGAKSTVKRGTGNRVKETKEIQVDIEGASLFGTLRVPVRPHGVVVFVHGSGSSRKSPREQVIARSLNRAGLATLLIDLLDEEEAADRWQVFDTDLLAKRLRQATEWLDQQEKTKGLPVGFFGASTGAAAAMKAAAAMPERVLAVVSRGGRPDLAPDSLRRVQSPTLLIVGENDQPVLELNRKAMSSLECENALVTVPGAGHLFEEPGTLEEVARIAQAWFERFLKQGKSASLTPFEEPPAPPP